MNDPKVEEWLQSYPTSSTKNSYASSFKRFTQFTGKSGTEMIEEARRLWQNPNTADQYALRVFQYQQHLLSEKAKLTGSTKGRRGGGTGRFKDKNLSQLTAKYGVAVVQAFFAYYNVPLSLKKFNKKDLRVKRPKVERKKHLFTLPELQRMYQIADLRDKCVIALGLAGQDEATVASLKTEYFNGKLGGKTLEIVELTRGKTNTDIFMVLTPETQKLLEAYIQIIPSGWLFPGYRKTHFGAGLPNKILKALCDKVEIMDNGRRASFHCLRLWFSARLRNKISDDIIDLLTGHALRYGGAYVSDDPEAMRKTLIDAGIIDLLQIEPTAAAMTEIELLKKKIADQEKLIDHLSQRYDEYEERMVSMEESARRARAITTAPSSSQSGQNFLL